MISGSGFFFFRKGGSLCKGWDGVVVGGVGGLRRG
jgi:hypothetical protein